MKTLVYVLMGLCIGLSGCASMGSSALGDATEVSLAQQLHEGVTTEKDVLAQYGEPQNKAVDPQGHQNWDYFYVKQGLPIIGGGKRNHLQLMFDVKGKLLHYALTTQ